MTAYLTTRKEWKNLVEYILEDGNPIGWDTEFDGVDFSAGDNCVGKSKLDVWSLAVFDGGYHPRGYATSKACVLPAEAISWFEPVLCNPEIKKAAHNATVDIHTAYNAGVDVLGVVDTLGVFRWLYPGRMLYGLDVLGREFLDDSKFTSFKELCGEPVFDEVEVEIKTCVCGEEGCRKRKLPDHLKYMVKGFETVQRKKLNYVDISSIKVGDPKWERKLDYAGQDAVVALGLYDYAITRMKRKVYENPFRESQCL